MGNINAIGVDPNDVKGNLKHAKTLSCEKCENESFKQSILLKKLSGILSPDGEDKIVPIMVFACDACRHVNKEFKEAETTTLG